MASAGGVDGKAGLGGMTGAGGAPMCPSTCAAPQLRPTTLAPDLVSVIGSHFYFLDTVYLTSTNNPGFWRIGLDGANEQKLYDNPLGLFRAVAIDPSETAAYLGIVGIYKLPLDAHGAAGPAIALDPHAIDATSGNLVVANIALDGPTIYYTVKSYDSAPDPVKTGGFFKISSSGGPPTQITKADPGRAVVIHGDYVYFSGDFIEGQGWKSGIVQIPRAGGPARLVYDGNGDTGPDRFVVTDSDIYLDSGTRNPGQTGRLVRVPLDGSSPVTLFTASDANMFNPRTTGLAVTADAVYLGLSVAAVDTAAADVLRIPVDGSALSTPFSTDAFKSVGSLLTVGETVYFGSQSSTRPGILSMNACGCAPSP